MGLRGNGKGSQKIEVALKYKLSQKLSLSEGSGHCIKVSSIQYFIIFISNFRTPGPFTV